MTAFEALGPQWTALGDIARENRRRFPQRTAVVCGDVRLTYPELDARVTTLASALARRGVKNGDRVAWLGQTCHIALELLLAAAKLGSVLCPINWRLSAQEMAYVLDDLDPVIAFWQDTEVGDGVQAARSLATCHTTWIQVDDEQSYETLLATGTDLDAEEPVDPALPVLAIYTAAFEGRPRGAVLHHAGLLATATVRAAFAEITCDTVYLNATNLYHIGNWDFGTLPTFLVGGTNVFVRRWNATEACTLVEKEGVTLAFMAGPMYEDLCQEADALGVDLSGLCPPEVFTQRLSGYGQTELHGVQTFRCFGGGDGSHGRASPIMQLKLVDPDDNEVINGEIGEIAMRGPGVMIGYRNAATTNAERMRGGWWHTNDLGRREPDGSIAFLGPKQRMLKSGAENVYPVEVEQAVASHPAVRQCAVIGTPDERWDQNVVAIVTLEPAAAVTAEEIIDHCRSRLASYKKPRQVIIVDDLPSTTDGRTDYSALDHLHGGGGYPGLGA